jgi:hypothetical protein
MLIPVLIRINPSANSWERLREPGGSPGLQGLQGPKRAQIVDRGLPAPIYIRLTPLTQRIGSNDLDHIEAGAGISSTVHVSALGRLSGLRSVAWRPPPNYVLLGVATAATDGSQCLTGKTKFACRRF